MRQESGSAKTPTWVGSCKVSVEEEVRQSGTEARRASSRRLRVVGRVTLGPGWACTGQGALPSGLLEGTEVPGYSVPRVPEGVQARCLGACMQYPAGASQPARLARPGQGGGVGGLRKEEEEEMGVSLGPILWRSLRSIVTHHPPSIRFVLLTSDARCQATGAQQPERTAAAMHCPCLLPSHHGCSTLPCGQALLTRRE